MPYEDYWKTHTVEQHEEFLRNLVKQNLSVDEMQKQICARFGEDTFLFKLKSYLTKSVNSRISYKMKDRYNHERSYFELREKTEEDVILSTNWYSYFENEVTLEELSKPIENFPPKTLMLIIIEALKQYITNNEEKNIRCLLLHDIYLSLKNYDSRFIATSEDGFIEFLNTRNHRIDLEDARLTGSVCPFCESTDVKSFGANWKCRTCGREFRKHRKKEEDS